MQNRLQRDQIVVAALDAVDSPSLDQKERPSGSLTGTLGVNWLQRSLDFFYKMFPIKGTLTTASIATVVGQHFVTLPSDFLMDFKDGIVWTLAGTQASQSRMTRRGLSYLLSMSLTEQGYPRWYAIINDTQMTVRPVPDKVYTGTLWYYKMPAALASTDIPPFPDDQVLVDFLEVRYKEWLQMIPKGSAIRYMKEAVAQLQKAGIGPEPEPDQIELDRNYYGDIPGSGNRDDWMGRTSLT